MPKPKPQRGIIEGTWKNGEPCLLRVTRVAASEFNVEIEFCEPYGETPGPWRRVVLMKTTSNAVIACFGGILDDTARALLGDDPAARIEEIKRRTGSKS